VRPAAGLGGGCRVGGTGVPRRTPEGPHLARVSGWHLPGALLIPLGFAALLAVTRLITATEPTAPMALPVVLVLAVAGLVLGLQAPST
jgi:peptidoglycan/LPS O-acetylase OafA/YrhL